MFSINELKTWHYLKSGDFDNGLAPNMRIYILSKSNNFDDDALYIHQKSTLSRKSYRLYQNYHERLQIFVMFLLASPNSLSLSGRGWGETSVHQ